MTYQVPDWQTMLWSLPGSLPTGSLDVLVLGGGLGGCCAAVAAAEIGLHVLLAEPGHLLGGQMSASGVGASDVWGPWFEFSRQGAWGQFVAKANELYAQELNNKSTATNGYGAAAFAVNAPIVDRLLTEWCIEAGVEVARNIPQLVRLDVTDHAAVARFGDIDIVANVVVDATEDGSGLALAGLAYRLGTSTSTGLDSSADTPLQDITYPAVIRRFDHAPVPSDLVFSTAPPNYEQYRGGIAKWYPQSPRSPGPDEKGFAGFRGLPDLASDNNYRFGDFQRITRTSLNYLNDVTVTSRYLTDPATFAAANRKAIEYTLGILYYLQGELGLPWAIATDEGFAAGPVPAARDQLLDGLPEFAKHLPPCPYIRESRRLVGATTLTYTTVGRGPGSPARWRSDTVAVCTYPYDIHYEGRLPYYEADLGETGPVPITSGPIPVPLAALVPPNAARLVAAEKNLSVSQTVNGATRVHPSVMATGQAAGLIAAAAVKLGCAPSKVPVRTIQAKLIEEGACLLPGMLPTDAPEGDDRIALVLGLLQNDPTSMVNPRTRRLELSRSTAQAAQAAGRGQFPSKQERL